MEQYLRAILERQGAGQMEQSLRAILEEQEAVQANGSRTTDSEEKEHHGKEAVMCPGQKQLGAAESQGGADASAQEQQPECGTMPQATELKGGLAAPKMGDKKGGRDGANGKGDDGGGGCVGPGRRKALICLSILFVLFLTACLLLIFLPCLPPYVSFPEYNATLPRPLIGRQLPKDWLSGATPVETQMDEGYEGDALSLMGPESLARRGGNLFTGILGGILLKLTPHDGGFRLTNLTKFGEPCQDISEGLKCGRPMGMRFHTDGLLYVTDAYLGLYSVDVETGDKIRLAKSHDYISGHRTMLANDLDIAKDGTIYWSDASTNVKVEDVILEFMSEPSGRLIRYDPVKKRSEALIRRVQCASGVQLSPDEDFVLVAEGGKDRILRYYLKGPKTGSSDIFIDGLPGVPDKIRKSGRPEGGYLVWCIISHGSAAKGSSGGILPWLRRHRTIRTMLMRGLFIVESMFLNAHERYGDSFSQSVIYSMGSLTSMAPFLLSEGLVLELDSHGNITGSFFSGDRSVSMASEMHVLPGGRGGVKGLGSIYVASPINPHLLQVPIREGPMLDMAMAYSEANTAPETGSGEADEEGLSVATIPAELTGGEVPRFPPNPGAMEWDRVHTGDDAVGTDHPVGTVPVGTVPVGTDSPTERLTDAVAEASTGAAPEAERREDKGVAETSTALPALSSLMNMVATLVSNWRDSFRTTTSEPSLLESFFATAETPVDTAWSSTETPPPPKREDSPVTSLFGEGLEEEVEEGSGREDDDAKGNLVLEDAVLRFLLGGKKKSHTVKVDFGQNGTVEEPDEDAEGLQDGEKNFIALDSIIDLTTATTPPPTTEKEEVT